MNELQAVVFVAPVPPSLSAWLEPDGRQMVAVCQAESEKPAANISWSHTGRIMETLLDHGDSVTMESRLELLQGTDVANLTCVVNHPYWIDQQVLLPQLKKGDITETNAYIFFKLLFIHLFIVGSELLCCSSRMDQRRKGSLDHCCHCCLSHCFDRRSFILCETEAICEVRSHFRWASSLHARRLDWVMSCRYCQQPDSSLPKATPVRIFRLHSFICCQCFVVTIYFCNFHYLDRGSGGSGGSGALRQLCSTRKLSL